MSIGEQDATVGIWIGAIFGSVSCLVHCLALCRVHVPRPLRFYYFMVSVLIAFGIPAGMLYIGPWYDVLRRGVGRNLKVNPAYPALDPPRADPYGMYFFASGAFVDSSRLGVYADGKSSRVCVAPIVNDFKQNEILYWALAFDWYVLQLEHLFRAMYCCVVNECTFLSGQLFHSNPLSNVLG